LHINEYGIYLETLCNSKPTYDQLGDIVATDLHNMAMPFIRYKIDDIGIISLRKCACGSRLRILEDVLGRHGDVFKKRDGTSIPGISFADRIITECRGIKQIQIVQTDYERFTLHIVKGTEYSDAAVEDVKKRINNYMHDEMSFEILIVNDIPREKSGKIRFCKCEIGGKERMA